MFILVFFEISVYEGIVYHECAVMVIKLLFDTIVTEISVKRFQRIM
jgi:hypothetical protein